MNYLDQDFSTWGFPEQRHRYSLSAAALGRAGTMGLCSTVSPQETPVTAKSPSTLEKLDFIKHLEALSPITTSAPQQRTQQMSNLLPISVGHLQGLHCLMTQVLIQQFILFSQHSEPEVWEHLTDTTYPHQGENSPKRSRISSTAQHKRPHCRTVLQEDEQSRPRLGEPAADHWAPITHLLKTHLPVTSPFYLTKKQSLFAVLLLEFAILRVSVLKCNI